MRYLKKIRVVLSIVFFIATFALFVDIYQWISEPIVKAIVYMQFSPSLLEYLAAAEIILAGFVFVIVLTLLFGRVYCSTICPLGTLQDIIIYIRKRKRFRKKLRFTYAKPMNYLRYPVLAITAVFLVFGISTPLLLLDPFSNFGRISVNIVRPVVYGLNHHIAQLLTEFKICTLYKMPFSGISIESYIFAFSFLLILIIITIKWGRIFCNTACPVGALLALFSKISLYKIDFDKTKCTSCKRCERVCKAQCIETKSQSLDFSRCVSCFNCIDVCPEGGFRFRNAFKEAEYVNTPFVELEK